MVYTVNLLEVYPEDKLLRFLVKPIVEYPISYALPQSALQSCSFANSLTQSFSVVSRRWYWIDYQVCSHGGRCCLCVSTWWCFDSLVALDDCRERLFITSAL